MRQKSLIFTAVLDLTSSADYTQQFVAHTTQLLTVQLLPRKPRTLHSLQYDGILYENVIQAVD